MQNRCKADRQLLLIFIIEGHDLKKVTRVWSRLWCPVWGCSTLEPWRETKQLRFQNRNLWTRRAISPEIWLAW